MSFTEAQVKKLSGKLSAKHVKTRVRDGFTLSYIEGWHSISEANHIFGFDAWDRETVMAQCVWESTQGRRSNCSYVARVRIKVRAGDIVICREGSGSGTGTGRNPGEAHERALKEAETDAMKRALTTFGNPFGLALYDKEQQGVRHNRSGSKGRPVKWAVLGDTGDIFSSHDNPVAFCAAIRMQLEHIDSRDGVIAFWRRNEATIAQLRKNLPDLKTEPGRHYGELLEALYQSRLQELGTRKRRPVKAMPEDQGNVDGKNPNARKGDDHKNITPHEDSGELGSDDFLLLPKAPRPNRDRAHLKFVASHGCLVCGRKPSQAHHILYAQPRALGRKVSDEWTVPLCIIHHRELHDHGNEQKWWGQKKIDPMQVASRLWNNKDEFDQHPVSASAS